MAVRAPHLYQSLRAFCLAAFAADLVTRGRVLPAPDPEHDEHALGWRPVLQGRDLVAADAFAAALPPAVRAEALDGIGDRTEVLPDRLLLYAHDGDAALSAASARGIRPVSALVRRSTLEDVFLHLTGRTLVD